MAAPLLIAAAFTGALAAQEAAPTIRGTIVGLDGNPAKNVRLELRRWAPSHTRRLIDLDLAEPDIVVEARSDEAGSFAVTAPAIGSYELHVLAEGTRLQATAPLRQRYQPLLNDVQEGFIELRRAKTITVTVRDEKDEPIAGAIVIVDTATPDVRGLDRAPPWVPRLSARTDQSGRVSFPALDGADRAIHVVVAGHLRSSQRTGASDVAVVLRAAPSRILEVRDARGRAVAGAVVREGDDLIARGVTGADGRFTVPVAPDGSSYQVEAAGLGYGQATIRGPSDSGPDGSESRPVIVELEPAALVEGRIVDASTGDPIGGAAVWASRRSEDLVYTSPEGTYSLVTWSGEWGVAIEAAASGYTAADLRIDPDRLARRDPPVLALTPAFTLAGVIVDPEGAAVAGTQLTITARPGPQRNVRLTRASAAAADGSFRLPGLPYDIPLDLRIAHDDFAVTWHELGPFERDRPPAPLRLTLTRGITALGRVVDARDQPLEDATVELWPSAASGGNPRRASGFGRVPVGSATSDREGRFRFAAVPEGVYDVEARRAGYAAVQVPGVEVVGAEASDARIPTDDAPAGSAEEVVEIGTVVLFPGARVEGKVVDQDGEAVAGVGIAAVPQASGGLRVPRRRDREPRVTSDANGRFVLDDLPHDTLVQLFTVHPTYGAADPTFVRTPTPELVILEVATGEAARRLRGQVLGSTGAPLAAARVSVVVQSANVHRSMATTTDVQGRFELTLESSGPVEVYASGPGHRPATVEVEDPDAGDEVILHLEPGATLVGRIVGPRGEPVIGARILASPRGGITGTNTQLGESDGEGRYRLDGLGPGLHDIEVRHPSFRPLRQEVEVELGETVADLELAPGLSISGQVVDERGTAVSGAVVRAVPRFEQRSMMGMGSPSGVDGEGRFELAGLAPGIYDLIADHPERGRTAREVRLEESALRDVELRLEPGIVLEGQVTGIEFDALAQIRIIAFRSAGSPSEIGSTRSFRSFDTSLDFEGRFELRGLSPGRWIVTARHEPDARTVQETIELVADVAPEPLVLRFEVEDAVNLSGVVQRDGVAVAGARVEARASLPSGGRRSTVTDHVGRFEMRDLAAAEWRVSAQSAGAAAFEQVQVRADTEIVLDLEETRVSLLVLDAATREPLADASAIIVGEAGIVESTLRQVTDRDGRLEVAAIPGAVTVNVERAGYAKAHARVDLMPGESREVIVELSAGHPLTVEILGLDDTPYEGQAFAMLRSPDGSAPSTGQQRRSPGRIVLDAVPAGSWIVEVHAEGFAPSRAAVTTPTDQPVRVRLEQGGRVRVSIPELAGEQRAFVIALDPEARPTEETPLHQYVRAGAPLVGGEAVLGPLPAGTWKLLVQIHDERALAAGGDPMRAPSTHEGMVQVVEGETVDAVMARTQR